MERWSGKIAIVTGSSSGIGAALSKLLVNHGVKVVGLARRLNKLQEVAEELGKDKFFPIQCDMSKEEDILKAFKWVEEKFGRVNILVNNAGVSGPRMIIESTTEDYRHVIDTNLIAPAICSREAIQSMKRHNVPGHIININSIAGQYAESLHIPLGMYNPSKYGLRALGTELRHEIILSNLKIKITNISPGAVLTDMYKAAFKREDYKNYPILHDEDVANAVIYALGTPEAVEIPEITIIPHSQVIGISHAKLMKGL